MDHQKFIELTSKVSNHAIAQAMLKTAGLLAEIEKGAGITEPVGSITCIEAARRLESMNSDIAVMKQVEDLSRRIFEVITPENVQLGHSWLKKKLTEVIAAN